MNGNNTSGSGSVPNIAGRLWNEHVWFWSGYVQRLALMGKEAQQGRLTPENVRFDVMGGADDLLDAWLRIVQGQAGVALPPARVRADTVVNIDLPQSVLFEYEKVAKRMEPANGFQRQIFHAPAPLLPKEALTPKFTALSTAGAQTGSQIASALIATPSVNEMTYKLQPEPEYGNLEDQATGLYYAEIRGGTLDAKATGELLAIIILRITD